ncbi:sensor histidine kinase [Brassicibacter mesophilus]|uniref:sensor histidine kinase n=1 Tax=Brassicibacter mesophilus TaxID=745119 RepID=UPI003D21E964
MRTILGKLWLGITSLVIIIILLLWMFQIVFLRKFYIEERKSYLSDKGNQISSILIKNNYVITNSVKEELESFLPSLDIRVLVTDNKDNIIYPDAPGEKFGNNKKPQFNLNRNKAFEKEIYLLPRRFPHFDSAFILVKVPIIMDKKLVGNVMLTSPLAPIEETTAILKKQLSIITLISLVIASLLALVFARYFSNPILKITNASKKMAEGDFSANVDIKSKDEIGILGNTINNMAIQLGQTETLRKEFIANISHELKTPISLIKAYGELIKDIELNEKNKHEYLDIIIDESNRLNDIVEDILYLSKMEAGIYKLEYSDFSIVELINQVVEKLNYFALQKNIKIKVEINNYHTNIYADENKMYQVFYNLVNNAINHSFNNSSISINITNIENIVRVEISDNGKGISEEDLPYIWDRFYKADKSRKRDNSGTGLGMSIVKNILDAHNFKYGIESEINKGTCVWIEIEE